MITSAQLGPNDILVLRVAVGNMPPQRAKEYLEKVKADMQEVVGTAQKIIAYGCREGDTTIGVLNRP